MSKSAFRLKLGHQTKDYQVLLTNPPYSSDHLERCLHFAVKSKKPFLLLLPCWVAKKPYFTTTLGSLVDSLFFITPLERYNYQMPADLVPEKPSWVGEDGTTSPFLSSWYVYVPSSLIPNAFDLLKSMDGSVLTKSLQASKWKLKKAVGRKLPEDEKPKKRKLCQKNLRKVPGTVEFD